MKLQRHRPNGTAPLAVVEAVNCLHVTVQSRVASDRPEAMANRVNFIRSRRSAGRRHRLSRQLFAYLELVPYRSARQYNAIDPARGRGKPGHIMLPRPCGAHA